MSRNLVLMLYSKHPSPGLYIDGVVSYVPAFVRLQRRLGLGSLKHAL